MKSRLLIMSISLVIGSMSQAMNIEEYMQVYKSKNSLLRSSEMSYEAVQGKVEAAEIDLAPAFTLGYLKGEDKSLPNQLSPHRTTEQFTAGIGKKFATGTSVQLNAQNYSFTNENAIFPGFDKYSTGLLGVTVKQSLWKDFFGLGTRTKVERQRSAAELEMTSVDLQRRGLLLEAETIFWDYIFTQENLKLKKANLDRSGRVQKWTAKRFENGISEKADDLNAKALYSLRQMELLMADNEYKNSEMKFRESLELTSAEKTPEVTANWKETRPYINDLKNKKNVIKIESYLSTLEAKTKALASDETLDSLRPDLSVFGTYNYTSYNRDREQSVKDMGQGDYPQSVVGVNFVWIIDNQAKSGLRDSMTKEAAASQLKAQKKVSDGLKAWEEYLRIYEVTQNQAQILDQVAQLQKSRSDAENDRFTKGRTITANVVTAETDSAEAESRALQARVGLRKYEAMSLLYMETSDIAIRP
ncbi:MAG: TolC family protein [Bdellovibrionaceae bacterium]|nr:TolC family protein [Pseudobdellovibrionaceae bacterium]